MLDKCLFHLWDIDTQISVREVKTIASSNFLLNKTQAWNCLLVNFRTRIFYLVWKTLQAILHCWIEFAPEDILLEIWANPAPMLLRLLPAEKALSLAVSSSNPSDRFNFDIDEIEMFLTLRISTFHCPVFRDSESVEDWELRFTDSDSRAEAAAGSTLYPHLSSDRGAKKASTKCSTQYTH